MISHQDPMLLCEISRRHFMLWLDTTGCSYLFTFSSALQSPSPSSSTSLFILSPPFPSLSAIVSSPSFSFPTSLSSLPLLPLPSPLFPRSSPPLSAPPPTPPHLPSPSSPFYPPSLWLMLCIATHTTYLR